MAEAPGAQPTPKGKEAPKQQAGHGQYMDKETAEAWLKEASQKNPDLKHWLEEEPDKPKRYRVAWKAPTGKTGNGEYMDKDQAEAWMKEGNEKYPEIQHWLEAEPEKPKRYRVAWESAKK